MWTAENRSNYERSAARYPSDVTDDEWALIEPHLPPERNRSRREILNAILYVLTTGCQWRQLPKDLPPKSTVHDYFVEWQCDGTLLRIHHALYMQARELAGKEASPTTTIVDSQSVKGAEKGGAHRSSWLRRGKENQRQEAARGCRHAGSDARSCRHAGERAGSRSDRAAAQRGAPPVPFPGARHCRQRLSRCHDRCRGEKVGPPAARDRQTLRASAARAGCSAPSSR